MCDACNFTQFDTIPAAHDVTCSKRAPYVRFERMASHELRATLPALRGAERVALAARMTNIDDPALRDAHENAARAARAAADSLARMTPRLGPKRSAADAARSWKA